MLFKLPFLLISLFLFTACGPSLHDVVPDIKLTDAFKQNKDQIHSFRGMATAFFSLQDKKGSAELLVVSQTPDHLRVETGNSFGIPLSVLTIYQGNLTYYVIPEENYYVGQTAQGVSKRVLPLALNEKDLLDILFFHQKVYEKFKKNKDYTLEFYELKEDERLHLIYPKAFKLTQVKTHEYVEVHWDEFDLNPHAFSKDHFYIEKQPQSHRIHLKPTQRLTPLFKGDDEGKEE